MNYNGAQFLSDCLQSLTASTYPNLELYLVDNGSTDDSLALTRRFFPTVQILQMEKNLGFSGAYNRATSGLRGDYYLFLNNDLVLEPGMISALVRTAEATPEIAAVTPKMVFSDDRRRINGCGGALDRWGFGLNIGIGEEDRGQYDQPREVFYAIGAAMLVKAAAWRRVGPFDERFFAYYEDADWCWRARLSGHRIMYAPATAYHKWRGTWTDVRRRMYYQERNRLASLLKNYATASLVYVLPIYALLTVLRIAWVSMNWGPRVGMAMLGGDLWNVAHLHETAVRRQQVQRSRVVTDARIARAMAPGSLELKYRRNSFLSVRR